MVSAYEVVEAGKAKGITISWSDVFSLYNRSHLRASGAFFVPAFVTQFISTYVAYRKPQTVLDPWVGTGSLLLPVMDAADIGRGVAIAHSDSEVRLPQAMSTKPVEWRVDKPQVALESLGTFDVVLSAPPWGGPKTTATIRTASGQLDVRDSETSVNVVRAATHINDSGEAVFILPNNFFFDRSQGSGWNALAQLGLYVNAVIALPPSAFVGTAIEANIVIISRTKTNELFVARLTPNQDPAPLLANLRKRKAGPAIELGKLVNPAVFRSWHALATETEIAALAQRSGLTKVALRELVEGIHLGDRTESGFEDLPNAVYLPLIGNSPVVIALSELRIKPQNCAQLVLRTDKVHPEFLAGFLNSSLGRKTRDALSRGAFIPKITKQSLLEADVYTAPLEIQLKVSSVGRELRDLSLRLEQLERDLWSRPVDADKVRRSFATLGEKDGLESWLETLPFPLASILWRYRAAHEPEHKNSHLLSFFEAAAQFLGTVMASAFHSDVQFFHTRKREWFEGGDDNPHSLVRSSFGEWVVRAQRLAKTTRQMLSGGERALCLDLYKTNDSEKIDCITSKGALSVLEKVSGYRNTWKGHSGIVSAKEYDRRLALLQEQLTAFWSALGPAFDEWWLIRPKQAKYTSGIYHFHADKLTGSRQIFKQIELETPAVRDANELYLFDSGTRQPLQLLHFFRMMSSPETDEAACYFYNRLEKDGIRWVSYHFEGKSERVESDPAILKVIAEVEQNNA
jgi:hypothetical protein